MSDTELTRVQELIRSGPGLEGLAPPELRAAYDELCNVTPPPSDVKFTSEMANGVPVEVGKATGAAADKTILYFHGGGYVVGSLASHRGMVAWLGKEAGMRTVAVDYRLSPENAHPAAVDDALAVYRWLLEGGVPARSIVIAGDSAGGGLSLALLLRARDEGLPMPSAMALFSPFVDLTGSGRSVEEKAKEDLIVTPHIVTAMAAAYFPGGDLRIPQVSPLFADLTGLPPMLIHVGSAECLFDDSLRLAREAGAAAIPVELKIWPRLPHVWQIFASVLEEGRRSLHEAGRYLARHVD